MRRISVSFGLLHPWTPESLDNAVSNASHGTCPSATPQPHWCGAFATNPRLKSFLSTRATSPSSLLLRYKVSRVLLRSQPDQLAGRSSPPVKIPQTSGFRYRFLQRLTLAIFFMWAEACKRIRLDDQIKLATRCNCTSVLAFLIAFDNSLAVSS